MRNQDLLRLIRIRRACAGVVAGTLAGSLFDAARRHPLCLAGVEGVLEGAARAHSHGLPCFPRLDGD